MDTVVVYWRPGCLFCASLRRQLRRTGVPTDEVNIWDDAQGAEFVRSHAGGNETVPTVDVAGTVLVNPGARQVLAAARTAGVAIGEPPRRWWHRRRAPADTDGAATDGGTTAVATTATATTAVATTATDAATTDGVDTAVATTAVATTDGATTATAATDGATTDGATTATDVATTAVATTAVATTDGTAS